MKKKSNLTRNLLIIAVVVAIFMCIFWLASVNNNATELSQTEFIQKVEAGEIKSVIAQDNKLTILKVGSSISDKNFKNGKYDYYVTYSSSEDLSALKLVVTNYNAVDADNNGVPDNVSVDFVSKPDSTPLINIIIPILLVLVAVGSVILILRGISKSNNNAMGFGKSKATPVAISKVKFSDVAGAEEEKKELQEIVEFLKNPKKFTEIGAKIPKGVLLVGNPGTGKTLFAKAVAGEGGVPFFSITGSDFVEMFVGVGASRVRDLFDKAKKNKPSIVFIDEIDAVGRQRGTGLGSQNDEREQTLNQLLTEMDGFENNEGVIVMAATNRADVLDPALTRPGRFDRQIYIHMPDVKGREEILRVHAKNKPIDSDVDFTALARLTAGFSGADLANLLNEAAILTARESRLTVRMVDITESISKVMMGPQKKSRVVTERDNKITAYHESGHAIIGKLLPELKDEIEEVSIISRGFAAGYTMSRPDTDDNHVTYKTLNAEIQMIMGGRIAEELIIKDISTGASNDIMRATELARKMVTEWGMSSNLGFYNFGAHGEVFIGRNYQSQNNYSDEYAAKIDEEVRKILAENYEKAKKILEANLDKLETMASLLIEKLTIYRDEINMVLGGETKENIVASMNKKDEEGKAKDAEAKKIADEAEKKKQEELKLKQEETRKQMQTLEQSGFITPEQLDELIKKQNNKK